MRIILSSFFIVSLFAFSNPAPAEINFQQSFQVATEACRPCSLRPTLDACIACSQKAGFSERDATRYCGRWQPVCGKRKN